MSEVSSNPDIAEQLRDLHHAWKASVTAPSRLHRCNHVDLLKAVQQNASVQGLADI